MHQADKKKKKRRRKRSAATGHKKGMLQAGERRGSRVTGPAVVRGEEKSAKGFDKSILL